MKAYAAGLLVLAGLFFDFNASEAKPALANAPKLGGIAYGPFRDGQAPDGDYPSGAEIAEDMKILKDHVIRVRTYGLNRTLQLIPHFARKARIESYPGAHIGSDPFENDREIARLLEVACTVRPAGLVVGNEVLFHGSLPREELIRLIQKVKSNECVIRWGIPVGYADVYTKFLDDPGLVTELDLLLIHIHPYHDAVAVGDAAEDVYRKWQLVKDAYPGKPVIIGETGWPSAGYTKGNAVPSEKNQQEFLKRFVTIALRENIPYFFFEAFDEAWKWDGATPETEAEAHWGLWYSDRKLKPRRFLSAPPPLCEIIEAPHCGAGPGKLEKISGRVYGINSREANAHRVVIYARTDRWYVQPLANDPITSIRRNGRWSNSTHLGDSYACLLVRQDYLPASVRNELPETDGNVFAVSVKECR